MKKKKVVIALGGNALGKNVEEQKEAVAKTAKVIVDLASQGLDIIITHGNGPQVGMIQDAMDSLVVQHENYKQVPLPTCVAMSQGYIGIDLQNAIKYELYKRNMDVKVSTILSQVEVDPEDEAAVTALLDGLDIELKYGADGLQHMYLDGEDVTDAIRQHVISRYTSGVSAIPAVRAFLLERQRDMAREHDVIMDGRDIGTVVLPGADVKIFLTASPEDRARRRFDELRKRGQEADYDTVLRDIILRDEHDTRRSAAPLRQAKDALLVDTTGNSLDESLDVLLETIKERLKA